MRKLVIAMLGIAGLIIALASCTSSSNGTDASSGATAGGSGAAAVESPSADGTPIEIGVICTCSGPNGNTGSVASKVAQAWANSVNSSDGIAGHPVKLAVYDDSSLAGTAAAKAQTLISDKVDVVLDLSIFDGAWADAMAKAKIPVVGGGFNHVPFYENPYFYPSGQTNDSITYAVVATAKLAGAENTGLIYCAESPQCQQDVAKIKAAGTKLGVPTVYTSSISKTAPNYTAQCIAAQQAHVTALIIEQSAPAIVHLAEDCNRQGYKPIYVIEGTGFTMLEPPTPGLDNGLWAPFPNIPFFADKPFVNEMNSVLDQYYPGLRDDKVSWAQNSVQAWTGLLLIEAAVKKLGSAAPQDITAKQVLTGLNSLNGETLGGWSPPLTFAAGKAHPVDCWFSGRVENGKPVLANNGELSCANGG